VTLLQELLKILDEVEELFGPRDRSYEILEPEFGDGHPHGEFTERKKITVRLTRSCADDYRHASYTLAHEAVHLLSPVFYGESTMLEEGIATWFSHKYVKRLYGLNVETTGDPKYDAALAAATELLAKNEFLIKELRTHQFVISRINARLLIEKAGAEPQLATLLASDFLSYGEKPRTWADELARDVNFVCSRWLANLGINRR